MRRLLIASLLAAAFAAHSVAKADTTSTGHSYTPPDAFTASANGALVTFTAPEGDASIVVVDLASAKDAADAVAQAWAQAQPGFKRTLRLATPRPSRNGWVDQQVYDYETSPNEKLVVQAIARRASTGDGKAWGCCCCRRPKARWKSAVRRSASSSPACAPRATNARASPARPPSR